MQDLSKNTVYSPLWQWQRVQMLGRWTTHIGDNIARCNVYLGDRKDISKIYRVLNMLNAVRMGFHGMGIVGSDIDNTLVSYRDTISAVYQQLREQGDELEEITEERVMEEWATVPKFYQDLIIGDLSVRYWNNHKSKHREDLKWFLNLIGAKV